MIYETIQRRFGGSGIRWLVLYEVFLDRPERWLYPKPSPMDMSIPSTEWVESHVREQLGELGLSWLRLGHKEKESPRSKTRKIIRRKQE